MHRFGNFNVERMKRVPGEAGNAVPIHHDEEGWPVDLARYPADIFGTPRLKRPPAAFHRQLEFGQYRIFPPASQRLAPLSCVGR